MVKIGNKTLSIAAAEVKYEVDDLRKLADSFDEFSKRNSKYHTFKSYSEIWMLSVMSSCMDH